MLLPVCACGGRPEAAPTFTGCSANGFEVQVQDGLGFSCQDGLATVYSAQQFYGKWGKWGLPDLSGWLFQFIEAPNAVPDLHQDATFWAYRIVVIGLDGSKWLSHEFHHVQFGPSSANHAGWCVDFEPWEGAILGLDEHVYLGCPQ
jgi:hypothetical protein